MTTDLEERKRALREEMKARRRALDPAWAAAASARAQARVIGSAAFGRARTVALYAPDGGEVDTEAIGKACADAGKRVVYPRMRASGQRMLDFAEVPSPSAGLVTGRHGIREPAPSAAAVGLWEVDLFVTPGLAFDAAGRRLGRGGGYYDTIFQEALGSQAGATRVGLAYEFQVVSDLPVQPGDARVDAVATEERWIEVAR
jgi:5-formyltetrahydrofolate cyclo-ligase